MVLEPWSDMVGAPMGREFLAACETIDPETDALHRKVALDCVAAVLGDGASAEVFLLALDGLLADPVPAVRLAAVAVAVAARRADLLRGRLADPDDRVREAAQAALGGSA